MKKISTTLLAVIIASAVFFKACDQAEQLPGDVGVPVVHIELNKTTAEITVGDTLRLAPAIFPENATNQTVAWLSTNPAVATVVNGIVTAVDFGNTNIVATTQDGNRSAVCAIVVAPVSVSGLVLQSDATLFIGNSLTLRATILPANATNRNLVWTSSNTGVATVNSNGVVTSITEGTANILVTTEDGDFTATVAINVGAFRCNSNTPGWGNSLGTVSFYTNQMWTITGYGISQIWSDAVTATNCQKVFFDFWDSGFLNADCRSNPGFPGDLFSSCAVLRFAEQLCPYPWRVPTWDDFRDLDIAMGGTGYGREDLSFVNTNYVERWGGRFGGGYFYNMGFWGQGYIGFYWFQTRWLSFEMSLSFRTSGEINPQFSEGPGLSLRCVRN